jgi:hypothetical protein
LGLVIPLPRLEVTCLGRLSLYIRGVAILEEVLLMKTHTVDLRPFVVALVWDSSLGG